MCAVDEGWDVDDPAIVILYYIFTKNSLVL